MLDVDSEGTKSCWCVSLTAYSVSGSCIVFTGVVIWSLSVSTA